MLDIRTISLIRVSTLASRPEFRKQLAEELRLIKDSSSATRADSMKFFFNHISLPAFPLRWNRFERFRKYSAQPQKAWKNRKK
jgi:hypothetical protein